MEWEELIWTKIKSENKENAKEIDQSRSLQKGKTCGK
jgi:hypothetical protein